MKEWHEKVKEWFDSWPQTETEYEFMGHRLVVPPGVFPPYVDTRFYTEALLFCRDDLRSFCDSGTPFLEMGCGPGGMSLMIAEAGIPVVGLDINPAAVVSAKLNRKFFDLRVSAEFMESDLFASVEGRTFGAICWNIPFNYCEEGEEYIKKDVKYRAGFDPGYRNLCRFARDSKKYLVPGASLFIGADKDICDLVRVESIFEQEGYEIRFTKEGKVVFGDDLFNAVLIAFARR